jgi:PEGA domain
MRKNSAPLFLLALVSLWIFPGCATLLEKRTQRIPVTSFPVGATVSVDGVKQGVTPLEIRLARKVKDQVIRIESLGYDPVEIRPQRKKAAVPIVGNLLIGVALGIVPAGLWAEANELSSGTYSTLIWALSTAAVTAVLTAIDTGGSGKGYELRPTELVVTLTKIDGTPRVAIIFLDADEFRSIKWIRVIY